MRRVLAWIYSGTLQYICNLQSRFKSCDIKRNAIFRLGFLPAIAGRYNADLPWIWHTVLAHISGCELLHHLFKFQRAFFLSWIEFISRCARTDAIQMSTPPLCIQDLREPMPPKGIGYVQRPPPPGGVTYIRMPVIITCDYEKNKKAFKTTK